MNQSKVSTRYAKAIFELAKEKGKLHEVQKSLHIIQEAIKSVPEIDTLLNSPIITQLKKNETLALAFGNYADELTLQFISLLVQNRREAQLPGIIRVFQDHYLQHEHIKPVTITTAGALAESTREQIVHMVENAYKSKAEIKHIQDPGIIGGLILRIDHVQVNLSVANQLNKIKNKIVNI
ncbi:MAG: ATP synthase F1 subunit delta [Bacteroidales bacterium]|nr:ATP synthase F1 subunit delta [Bacteroidales bacterium]